MQAPLAVHPDEKAQAEEALDRRPEDVDRAAPAVWDASAAVRPAAAAVERRKRRDAVAGKLAGLEPDDREPDDREPDATLRRVRAALYRPGEAQFAAQSSAARGPVDARAGRAPPQALEQQQGAPVDEEERRRDRRRGAG